MKKNIFSQIGRLLAVTLGIAAVWTPSIFAGPPFKGTDTQYDYILCTIDSATGSFAQAQSTYTVQGDCQVYTKNPDPKGGSTFSDLTDAFIWTATGTYQPDKYNTAETISVRRPTSTQFTTPVIATIYSTMLCGQDPWLKPDGLSCGSVRYQQVGSLGSSQGDAYVAAYLSATNPVVPRSSMLSAQQRAALVQEYQKQHLSSLNLQNKPATMPNQPPTAATVSPANSNATNRVIQASAPAPVMTSPTANSKNTEGKFQVKGTVPGSYTGNEGVFVQFTFLGTATTPSPTSFVNTFNISLKDLINGITVPSYVTRGGQGRWLVRAQVVSPNAGPWSASVPFMLTPSVSSTTLTPSLNKK